MKRLLGMPAFLLPVAFALLVLTFATLAAPGSSASSVPITITSAPTATPTLAATPDPTLLPRADRATIALAVGAPIRLNQAVPITITVHANTDIRQMGVLLISSVPHALIQEDHS